jgi:hypothetical protein
MGLLIKVSKIEAEKAEELNGKILNLCERIIEKDGHAIYFPHGGKLIDVIKVMMENGIQYSLVNDPPERI